jgi:hypothetical protein
MCVILVGNKKSILNLDLHAAWNNNPHGAGFAYINNGRAHVVKGLMCYDSMMESLSACKHRGTIALHLRFATHGAINGDNTHPFRVGRTGDVLMHNGILSAFGISGDRGLSDSADLARVLGGIRDPRDRDKVLRSIHGMFTLVTPRARSGVVLFGSNGWQMHDGVRCSNTYWIPRAHVSRAHVCNWQFKDDNHEGEANGLINI